VSLLPGLSPGGACRKHNKSPPVCAQAPSGRLCTALAPRTGRSRINNRSFTSTAKLIEEVSEGRLDTAIVALPVSEPSLTEVALFAENFLPVPPGGDVRERTIQDYYHAIPKP